MCSSGHVQLSNSSQLHRLLAEAPTGCNTLKLCVIIMYTALCMFLQQFLSLSPSVLCVGDFLPLRVTPRTPLLGEVPSLHGGLRLVMMYPEETAEPRKTVVREDGGHGLIATHWSDVVWLVTPCTCVFILFKLFSSGLSLIHVHVCLFQLAVG